MDTRIDLRFKALLDKKRPALVTFVTAGDPDYNTSFEIIKALPRAGADIIELGMPFSDPIADGLAIQLASQRALKSGQTVKKTLQMVHQFRKQDDSTPVILMGYYNPVYIYGKERFLHDAYAAGVDGLIIVDLPIEANNEFCIPTLKQGMNFIHLVTPATDTKRLLAILKYASGFIYYVSTTGVTGTSALNPEQVAVAVSKIKELSKLPVAAGFGIKTSKHVRLIGKTADAIVVGSVLVNAIADSIVKNKQGKSEKFEQETKESVITLVRTLAYDIGKIKK